MFVHVGGDFQYLGAIQVWRTLITVHVLKSAWNKDSFDEIANRIEAIGSIKNRLLGSTSDWVMEIALQSALSSEHGTCCCQKPKGPLVELRKKSNRDLIILLRLTDQLMRSIASL